MISSGISLRSIAVAPVPGRCFAAFCGAAFSDGETIVSVPLERNLLLYKGQFHASMSDDEYLDREDDYNITFILDKNNNWDSAAMIYINNWATLPVQYQEW